MAFRSQCISLSIWCSRVWMEDKCWPGPEIWITYILHISECAHMIHYISLECQSQPACYGLDKTNIFIRRYILYFIRYFVNFWRKLQTTTTSWTEDDICYHSADVETGRPLQHSLLPATLLTSEGYYTLFFGFNLSQTAFFAQTALNFSRFDVIILKLVSVSE